MASLLHLLQSVLKHFLCFQFTRGLKFKTCMISACSYVHVGEIVLVSFVHFCSGKANYPGADQS